MSNKTGGKVGPRDRAVIAGELGRAPRDLTGVAVRCPHGYPAVTETAPVLSEGAPNPTLLYVTCPELATVISRVETTGGVRSLRATCQEDPELGEILGEITHEYQERRAALLREGGVTPRHDPRLGAGIGGPEGPDTASCLHAHAAALLAVMSGWLVPARGTAVEAATGAWSRFFPALDTCWCTDRRCAKWDTGERRAVIDVGTISVRLLVADVIRGHPWSVTREAEVTRLGEGLDPGKNLLEAARARTAEAVGRFVDNARLQGAEKILLIGTSATREAKDGDDFVRTLGRQHGLEALVVTGEREAALAYAGVCLDVPGDPVVVDVGGGSTELVVRQPNGRTAIVSLPLGASRATDRWIKSDPPTADELDEVAREAGRALAKVRNRFGATPGAGAAGAVPRRLVGVAGTVTTLAAMAAALAKYDPRAIHLRRLSLDQVCGLLAQVASLTTAERAMLPCMQPGRAPVIVGGAVIVMTVMEALGYQELTVSERDLLDGLVMEGA